MTPAAMAELACVWEATARKVGNVHPGASFADLTYTQFVASAAILGRAFAGPGPFSRWILETVEETRRTVGTNTNLGLALVLAPLAACGGRAFAELPAVLQSTTVADAERVYAAVRAANPGGLGDVPEQDVRESPTVTLVDAMALAADRDQIARQYATGFADVFAVGVPALAAGFERFGCVEAAIVHCQLTLLKSFPDSLIARKCGQLVALDVQKRAFAILESGGLGAKAGRAAGVAFDDFLRSDGHRLNPGTTADLVAGCLFAALAGGILTADAPIPWAAEGWL